MAIKVEESSGGIPMQDPGVSDRRHHCLDKIRQL